MVAWSGLFDGVYSGGYNMAVNKPSNRNQIASFIRKFGMAADRELLDTLLGGSVGDTASLSVKRVVAVAGGENLGGVRAVNSHSVINRATTAADVTMLKDYLSNINDRVPVYPGDKSGNGK